MAQLQIYDRDRVVRYAKKWAYKRNPLFYDFRGIGGDCSNFISQCLFAGCCTMNFTETFGWYYLSLHDRAPAWTGVKYLYNFLTGNKGPGPHGRETNLSGLEPGDIVQLGRSDGTFYHSLLVTGLDERGLLVSAHSDDAYNRPLSSYRFQRSRGIHILGYRAAPGSTEACDCFEPLLLGEALIPCS